MQLDICIKKLYQKSLCGVMRRLACEAKAKLEHSYAKVMPSFYAPTRPRVIKRAIFNDENICTCLDIVSVLHQTPPDPLSQVGGLLEE